MFAEAGVSHAGPAFSILTRESLTVLKFTGRMLTGLYEYLWGGKDAIVVLGRLARLVAQERWTLLVGVLCMAGYNVFTAAPAWYIKDVVDTLQKGDRPTLYRFVVVGGAIVGIFAMRGLFFYCQQYLIGKVAEGLVSSMREHLFHHMQKLSLSFFSTKPSGELVSRFTTDLVTLQESLRVSVSGPLRDLPQILMLLGMLLVRSWQLFLASVIIIPVAAWLIAGFGKRNQILTNQRLISFGEMTALLMETINGIRVVKAFGMEKYEDERFCRANAELQKRNLRMLQISAYSTPVLEVIGAIAGGFIFMLGGYLIIHARITTGDFASFLFLFFTLNDPIKKLNGFTLKVQEGIASAARVFELMAVEPEIVDKPGAVELGTLQHSIDIRVDNFIYEGNERPALSDVHIEIRAGQVVALVGTSGSGKTTLVNLLPRFYDVKNGAIRIDGQDIRDVTIASLRSQIAVVTQDIFLFNDTVTNNIAYGKIDCPREQIVAAAIAANAHDFIEALPQGYETVLGERGMHLSGGQRQRVAIARALIKNAPILILDEATSALDSESEREVQTAIEHLLAGRTTIVIAHRLSTIRRADRIYVLERGRIVEQGRHEDLLAAGGVYKRLYEMQFRDDDGLVRNAAPWPGYPEPPTSNTPEDQAPGR
jgi:subfamily B ATP-binding cassette protein MsbA